MGKSCIVSLQTSWPVFIVPLPPVHYLILNNLPVFPVLQTEWSSDANWTVNPSSGIWRTSTPSSSESVLHLQKSLKDLGGGSQWESEHWWQRAKERLMLRKGFPLFFFLVRNLLWFPGLYHHNKLQKVCCSCFWEPSALPHTAVPQTCAAVVFSEVQEPEHYIPPSYGLVSACWMLCLEVAEPGRAGQPQCRGAGGSEKAPVNARTSCACGFPRPRLGCRSVMSLLCWDEAWVELCV